MATQRRTSEPQDAHPDEPKPMEADEVTTTAHIMGGHREVEIDPIEETPVRPDNKGMIVIRMNTTIEDFTYGNPHMHLKLEEGKRYRMPVHIAAYLDGLGYVWH